MRSRECSLSTPLRSWEHAIALPESGQAADSTFCRNAEIPQPANRGHLHARYPFKLLVAGGPLIEGILRRVMGPTKIHQALCRGGSVLRKRGGFYTEPAFNA
jgi:hypothetical protein